jgi:hypothetical protein
MVMPMMVAVVMVMMPIMMAVTAVMDVPVMRARMTVVIHWRRRDHYWRRADRRHGHACRCGDNDGGNRKGNPDVNAKRYAGVRRGGACGSEGDCDCTE